MCRYDWKDLGYVELFVTVVAVAEHELHHIVVRITAGGARRPFGKQYQPVLTIAADTRVIYLQIPWLA